MDFSLKDVSFVLPLGPTTNPLLILFWVLLGAVQTETNVVLEATGSRHITEETSESFAFYRPTKPSGVHLSTRHQAAGNNVNAVDKRCVLGSGL